MAIRFANVAGRYLRRTTNLPDNDPFTFMAWVNLRADLNTYTPIFYRTANNFNPYWFFGTNNTGTVLLLDINEASGAEYTGGALVVDVWAHVAFTRSGTTPAMYLNGVPTGTPTILAPDALTNDEITLGHTDDADGLPSNLAMAAEKIFNAALTQAEIQQEMRSFTPYRTLNLNTWLPCVDTVLANNAKDLSGNGYDMTVGGTPTIEDGPPIPWRSSRRNRIYVPSAAPPTTQGYIIGAGMGAIIGG